MSNFENLYNTIVEDNKRPEEGLVVDKQKSKLVLHYRGNKYPVEEEVHKSTTRYYLENPEGYSDNDMYAVSHSKQYIIPIDKKYGVSASSSWKDGKKGSYSKFSVYRYVVENGEKINYLVTEYKENVKAKDVIDRLYSTAEQMIRRISMDFKKHEILQQY